MRTGLVGMMVVWFFGLLTGCEAITGPSELERQIAAEQKAISAYSAKVVEVDGLQRAFRDAWNKANEHKNIKTYRDALKSTVLPALSRYVEAAEAMPLQSDKLEAIHSLLTTAYAAARDAFVAFEANLTEDTVETGYKLVLEAMAAVTEAEASYRDKLNAYYLRNRVELVSPDQL